MLPEEIEGARRLKDVEAIIEHLAGELRLAIELLYQQWLSVAGEIKELDKP